MCSGKSRNKRVPGCARTFTTRPQAAHGNSRNRPVVLSLARSTSRSSRLSRWPDFGHSFRYSILPIPSLHAVA